MKWNYDPAFIKIFGECLVTVFRGKHLVMTASEDGKRYVIQESVTKKHICSFRRKGDCYKFLKASYHPDRRV